MTWGMRPVVWCCAVLAGCADDVYEFGVGLLRVGLSVVVQSTVVVERRCPPPLFSANVTCAVGGPTWHLGAEKPENKFRIWMEDAAKHCGEYRASGSSLRTYGTSYRTDSPAWRCD